MKERTVIDFLRAKEREMLSDLDFKPAATYSMHVSNSSEKDLWWRGAAVRWLSRAKQKAGARWRLRTIRDDDTDVRTVLFELEDGDHLPEFERAFEHHINLTLGVVAVTERPSDLRGASPR